MGAAGSGWPMWKPRRATTESSLALDVRRLSRDHSRFKNGSHFVHTWRHQGTTEPSASVSVRVSSRGSTPSLVLAYRTDGREGAGGITSVVALDATSPFFGGVRYWFVCPSCGRRTAILYLPFRRKGFLCRRCHGLTYQSSQDSHRFDRLLFSVVGDHGNDIRKALVKRLRGLG